MLKKALLLLCSFFTLHSFSQKHVVTDSMLWQTNGPVRKVMKLGDTLIVAGDFGLISPNTPYAATFDSNGNLLKNFPHTNGNVTKAITDDKNGFYIAGDFSKVGNKYRGGLAYIDSSGNVSDFFKNKGVNGKIYDLELKDSTLYVAGEFTGFNTFTGGGAKVSIDSGMLDFSMPEVDGRVYALEADGEGGVYIGGDFTKVGEFYRQNVAHIDKYGMVTPWNPGTDGEVRAIAATPSTVYIGGTFIYAGCEKRPKIAAFERENNSPTSLDVNSQTSLTTHVFALVVYGGKLYIGTGISFNGSAGSKLIAVKISTGTVSFEITGISDIHALAKMNGGIYAAGDITVASYQPKIMVVDTTTGAYSLLNNILINGTVYCLKAQGDSVLYIGGNIANYGSLFGYRPSNQSIITFPFPYNSEVFSIELLNDSIMAVGGKFKGSKNQINLAAFNLRSKSFSEWVPNAGNTVYALKKISTNYIYCGGIFNTVCGEKHYNIAAINKNTSEVKKWGYFIDSRVSTLKIIDTFAYIGGYFTQINNKTRNYLAKVSIKSDSLANWNPSPNQYINCLEAKGDTLIVGGGFTNISSTNKSCLVALNTQTGGIHNWGPTITGGTIYSLVRSGNSLYFNGAFTKINGVNRYLVGAIDINSSTLKAFNPNLPTTTPTVSSIGLWKNNIVCVGLLGSYSDNPRKFIALFDTASGNESSTKIYATHFATTVVASTSNNLFIGGEFLQCGGKVRKNIAMIDLNTGEPNDWYPDVNNMVFDFDVANGKIFFAGNFTSAGGKARNYLAAANLHNDTILNWDPNPNSPVAAIRYNSGNIFIGGGFTTVKGNSRKYFTSVDTLSGQPSSLDPFSSSTGVSISSLHSFGNDVYIGGSFTSYNGSPRNYFASINGASYSLNSFDPKLSNGTSMTRVTNGFRYMGKLYFSGDFMKSDTSTSPGFIRVDEVAQSVDKWSINTNNIINAMGQNDKDLYLTTAHAKINNKCRCYVAAIDTSTKKLTPWYPAIDLKPNTIAVDNDKVYMGGGFTHFNNEINTYLVGAKLNSVGIEDISNNSFCLGGEMKIKIETTGKFDTSDTFILILSDTLGGFKNPLFIDTIYSPTDSFLYKIPLTTIPKNNYRLKVVSTVSNLENREDFYINILPQPKADFAINDPYQCLVKNTFQFTNQSNLPGNVDWFFGDSTTGKKQKEFHAYKYEFIFPVMMVLHPFGNGCPNDSVTNLVEILPQPHPAFTVNDSVQCNHSDSFVFSNTSIISNGSLSYLWDYQNGTYSTDTNSFTSYADTGWHTITLFATSDSGCIDSIKNRVLVINKPIATFTVNNPSQCINRNLFEFVNTTTPLNYFSLKWFLGDNDTASSDSVNKTFAIDSTYIIKLLVIKDSACYDSSLQKIFINPHPSSSFIVDSSQKCTYDTFFFTNNTTINSGTITNYVWRFGDGNTSSGINTQHYYDSTGLFSVTLVSTSDSGCVDTINTTITTNPLPKTEFDINDTLQCFNTQLFVFNDKSATIQNDSIIKYEWSLGDGTFSSLKTVSHTYNDTGYYFVLLKTTNTFGCYDTAQLIAAVAPNPHIDTIFGPRFVKSQDTNTYSIVNDTFTTYFWSVDYGSLTYGSDSSYADIIWDSVTSKINATIKIFPINIAGCFGDTAYLTIVLDTTISTGIIKLSDNSLNIYPNPTNKSLYVSFENNYNKEVVLSIYDPLGKQVYKGNMMQETEIDVSAYAPGIYTIVLINDRSIISSKFMVINKE